jgi:hypothetical protein
VSEDIDDLIGPEPPGVLEGLTREEREEEFFRLLGQGCRVREAAAAVKLNWSHLYAKRRGDEAFAKRWESATRIRVEHLVAEAERRAIKGSDKLLMFLLTNYAPERFKRHSALEITNPDGSLAATGAERAERTAALLAAAASRRADKAAREIEDLL